MDDSTAAAGGVRAYCAGRVRPASWGSPRGGDRVGGRLKPDVKVTTGENRPPRLGGDVVTFEDMCEFLVAYLEFEQQMHVANEDGGDRVLAGGESWQIRRHKRWLLTISTMASPGSISPSSS